MSEQTTNLHEAKKHLEGYVNNHLELAKLEAAERTAKVAASVAVSLSTFVLVLAVLVFLSLAAAFYLGQLLAALYWGFLLVSGFYLLLLVLFAVFGKTFFQQVYTNSIIKKIFRKHD